MITKKHWVGYLILFCVQIAFIVLELNRLFSIEEKYKELVSRELLHGSAKCEERGITFYPESGSSMRAYLRNDICKKVVQGEAFPAKIRFLETSPGMVVGIEINGKWKMRGEDTIAREKSVSALTLMVFLLVFGGSIVVLVKDVRGSSG